MIWKQNSKSHRLLINHVFINTNFVKSEMLNGSKMNTSSQYAPKQRETYNKVSKGSFNR